jgi:hypothetical protein
MGEILHIEVRSWNVFCEVGCRLRTASEDDPWSKQGYRGKRIADLMPRDTCSIPFEYQIKWPSFDRIAVILSAIALKAILM